ncbi:hypothetical protein [Thalassospira sp.]|uniref:hypothetical protein n=1 Tax=Thalassospira sp. TaxID=1912094 RepID=UPI000C39DC18|nr:hypothetical protein [Thalassospira sp.]MBC07324.1 citrate lyase ligase [Thalassospira sp.]
MQQSNAYDIAKSLIQMADQFFAVPADFEATSEYSTLRTEPVLQAALELAPDSPDIAYALARFYESRENMAAAIKTLTDLRFRGIIADATILLECKLRLHMSDLDGALDVFRQAKDQLSPNFFQPKNLSVLLRTFVGSEAFKQPLDKYFDKLFFIEHLLSKPNSWLQSIGPALQESVMYDLFAYMKAKVESQGARFIVFYNDDVLRVKNRSETENMLLGMKLWQNMGFREKWLRGCPPHIEEHYKDIPHFSTEYLGQVFDGPQSHIQSTRLVLQDMESSYINVSQGCRHTVGQPKNADNRVMLFGASDVFGYGSEDGHTISSHLQSYLTQKSGKGGDKTFKVENHGLRGSTVLVWFNNILHQHLVKDDVVIVWSTFELPEEFVSKSGIEYEHINLSRPHDHGELFIDHSHVGPRGNKLFGERIAQRLSKPAATTQPDAAPITAEQYARAHNALGLQKYTLYRTFSKMFESQGLDTYLSYLDEVQVPGHKKYGSVAVNCNPFTLGHLHLLEYAAKQVDFLYVFVIEEDMSFFPFKHRKEMVRNGLAHLKNVKVIDGGRYICTTVTFPEYFSKEDKNDVPADASVEAWFFCEYIAPRLGITEIFLGDEPKCQLTKKYNAKMAEILPTFGIGGDIIPRISNGNQVISASSVRAFLKEGDFESIGQITPETTLEFLKKHYAPQTA